jgi:hypothetical protein
MDNITAFLVILLFTVFLAFIMFAMLSDRLWRVLWRRLGVRCHQFVATHRSGYSRRCVRCGEHQSEYRLAGDHKTAWWETTEDGDGSCSEKPLPARLEWYQ